MRLQGKNGVIGKLVSWNLSASPDWYSYALVMLEDRSLIEWRIMDCLVIENSKTSEAKELAATAERSTGQGTANNESSPLSRTVCGPTCPWCGRWVNVTIERSA